MNATPEELVLQIIAAEGPVGHGTIVGWVHDQYLKPDRTRPTSYDCECFTNAAINTLCRAGKIELYDIGAAWVVT